MRLPMSARAIIDEVSAIITLSNGRLRIRNPRRPSLSRRAAQSPALRADDDPPRPAPARVSGALIARCCPLPVTPIRGCNAGLLPGQTTAQIAALITDPENRTSPSSPRH